MVLLGQQAGEQRALQPNGNDLPQYLLARQPNGTLGFNIQPNDNGTPGPFGGYTPIPGASVG
ncbi:hypothetical protein [Actinomadura sp. 21ATH]|uniref:hypothetical protein n=1 Tax=Actinomadura sp. 21ATH TaxID=1735444 RepID=UPI0035C095A0